MRIDRGKDFLSRTVTSALGALAIPGHNLPAYSPHLKGTVENLNRCAERMLFASLPRYTHTPAPRCAARTGRRTPCGMSLSAHGQARRRSPLDRVPCLRRSPRADSAGLACRGAGQH
ncbi:hypothetical protein HS99_0009090 [Kitasatospora aureofaciens]|uniref:Integrase catalytic domain-containing protein n=1 Tax=Kitasatospora aureofaciens TaxID=1894 RepID=A0A1E7N1T6_KITAU|nr:hypothetical protein B6264_26700 [Kitasatospora aureofaciens]OEV34642.1 hypothetical protein HS99_0009090 [Kitasatospora aureofaciens]GGV01773.1 hypothetical protein GCM10010502_65460 [Kitasatospora aureofaciens]